MDDIARCGCGSTWFEVQPWVSGSERGLGAVSITRDERIVAVSGVYICLECGVPWEDVAPPRLRVVG